MIYVNELKGKLWVGIEHSFGSYKIQGKRSLSWHTVKTMHSWPITLNIYRKFSGGSELNQGRDSSGDLRRMFWSQAGVPLRWEGWSTNHVLLLLQGEVGCGPTAERSCPKKKWGGHGKSQLVCPDSQPPFRSLWLERHFRLVKDFKGNCLLVANWMLYW